MAKMVYGIVSGTPRYSVYAVPLAASQTFAALSGRYIVRDDDVTGGNASLATTTAAHLDGYVDGIFTSSATAGVTRVPVVENILDVVAEIPAYNATARETVTDAKIVHLLGETLDTNVVSGVQYADIALSTRQTLQVVGGSAADNCLYVVANSRPAAARDNADIV